jgi:hypothetical protein
MPFAEEVATGQSLELETMKQPLRRILFGGTALACCAVSNLASAQLAPPPPLAGPIAASS